MILKRLAFAAVAALLAPSPALAGEELLFGPAPEWVEPGPAVTDPADDTTVPVRILRGDRQTRLEGGRQTTYAASFLKIQTPQGLDAGNISLAWRPETDDLTIHRVAIRRGGETIDVLASGQTFTTLRREQNLERSTLDGVLTANLFPEDLQVGDILEIETSITSSDPVFPGHSEELIGPLNALIDSFRVRLMWPSGSEMNLAKTDDLPAWRRSKKAGFEIAELQIEDLEPVPMPRGAPLRYSLVRFIQASNFGSWADLAAMQAPLYAKAAQVPADGPLRNEIERIRQSSSDPLRQAEAALRLVQSRVRYVALAMGEGGYVPADATLTWSRRFGDCKGKTALLLAILGELGIEAEAVLANTVFGDSLPDRLPAVGAFDHVLVRAMIGGRSYWLDGTRTGDTALDRLAVPYFDWGLPLVAQGAELVRMLPEPLETPLEDLVIVFDGSKGLRAPLPAKLEITLRGDTAVGINQSLAGVIGDARDRALREYWRGRFEFVEPEQVGYTFDEAAGEARLTLEGLATLDWNGVWYETDETGVGYQADFSREPGPMRDAAYSVAHPFYDRTRQTIILPPGSNFNGNNFSTGAEVSETVAGIEYRRHASIENDTFVIERSARSVMTEFAASEAPEFEKRLRALRDRRVYLRLPNGYRSTEAELAVASTPSDDVPDLIAEGNSLLNAGQLDDAIAKFTRATELAPGNAVAWADRGIALAQKGSFDEARVDLNRAAAIEPRNAVVFRGRGLIAERQRDFPAAIAAYGTAIEIEPSSSFAWGHRAMSHMGNNEPDRAFADAAEALKLSATYVDMYSLRAFILISKGKRDEAAAEIDAMLAANPDNPYAASVAGNAYRMLGREDEARSLVEQSLSTRPNALTLFQRSQMRDSADTAGRMADLDEALRLTPEYFPALAARAHLRSANGDLDGAFADADQAIRLNPQQRELYTLKAYLARRKGLDSEAAATAEALIANVGSSSPALVEASRIYASLGMHEAAVAAVDKALAINPEPFLYLDRSAARDPTDFDARLADIEAALRRSPNYSDGLAAKAYLMSDRGDTAGAVRAFGQALALRPSDPGLLTGRGIALAKGGRQREAERDFAQARRVANEMGASTLNSICYQKAIARLALERALDECEASLGLVPDFAPTLDSRGTVLVQLGRLDEAISDFDRVLEKSPTIYTSRYLRAMARALQGDSAAAEADLAIVREENPDLLPWMERRGFVIDKGQAAAVE